MNSLIKFDIREIRQLLPSHTAYNNEVVIVQMNSVSTKEARIKADIPIKVNALTYFLICEGEMELDIDYVKYKLKKGMLIEINDLHVTQDMRTSDDFRGYHMIISDEFVRETLSERVVPIDFIIIKNDNFIQLLEQNETNLLEKIILRIEANTLRTEHKFQRIIVKNEISTFILEFVNILYKHLSINSRLNVKSRSEGIMVRMQKLVTLHFKEQHEISFYAKQLCITPRYLSGIIKETSGKTVHQWISKALISEAKMQLRNPKITLQQITDILHFSDTSSFGKFFKKNCGITPSEYRKNL